MSCHCMPSCYHAILLLLDLFPCRFRSSIRTPLSTAWAEYSFQPHPRSIDRRLAGEQEYIVEETAKCAAEEGRDHRYLTLTLEGSNWGLESRHLPKSSSRQPTKLRDHNQAHTIAQD